MRPIHVLILLVAIAGVLVAALYLAGSDGGAGPIAPPTAEAPSGTHADPAVLEGPDAKAREADRTKVAPAPVAGTSAQAEGAGVRGRVVDENAQPVAGAIVYAGPGGGPFSMPLDADVMGLPGFQSVHTTTDAQGRFTLTPSVQGMVGLAVRASGFAPFDVERPLSGAATDVGDLVLERGAVILGRVLDAAGRAVAGAGIHRRRVPAGGAFFAFGEDAGPVVATTDAGGAFRVDQLAVGPWSLLVTSEDHPDKSATGQTDRPGQVVSDVLIRLDAGFPISGRLVGAPQEEIAELQVRAVPVAGASTVEWNGSRGTRTTRVRPDGSFTIGGCREDQAYRVVARAKERLFRAPARSATVDARAGDRNVLLEYLRETALVFQVVDAESGKPIEELSVSAGYRWPTQLLEEGSMKPQRHFPEGRVRYGGLKAPDSGETARLRVDANGYDPVERSDLRVEPGVDNDLGIVRMRRGQPLHVTVLDASTGAPVAGARVSLNEVTPSGSQRGMTFSINVGDDDDVFGGSGAAQRGTTDADGKVRLSSLPGKRATISVSERAHADFTSAPIDLPEAGEHAETVRLLRGGTVVVQVVDAAGKPVPGLGVDHRAGDEGMVWRGPAGEVVTNASGEIEFAHLPAGKHRFRVRVNNDTFALAGGGGFVMRTSRSGGSSRSDPGWTETDVTEGGSSTLTLLAPALGTLTGRVRESGRPLAGATVRIRSSSDEGPDLGFLDSGTNATTNASGEFELAGVTAGDYRVTVTHPSRTMPWRGETSVRDGANRFDVELAVAIVEGRITGDDGKPLAGVKVRAELVQPEGETHVQAFSIVMGGDSDEPSFSMGTGGGATPVTTDADGRYRLRGVTPDVGIQVVASSPGVQTARSERVQVGADQTLSGVDLVMHLGATVEVVTRRPDGKPASGCIVQARPIGGDDVDPKVQFVGSTGRVTFTGLVPGRWRFTCSQAGPDSSGSIPPQEIEAKLGAPGAVTFDVPD